MVPEEFPFEILKTDAGSTEIILDLLRETMGETAVIRRSEEFWNWKHINNPFGPSCGIYAWDKEQRKAVGLRVFMRWTWKAAGDNSGGGVDGGGGSDAVAVRAVRAVDTATHPDYQRRGIFSVLTKRALADVKEEGVDFVFNTPNAQSLPGYIKMGWQVVDKLPMYARFLRPWNIVKYPLNQTDKQKELPPRSAFFKDNIVSWQEFEQSRGKEAQALVAMWESLRNRVGYRTPRDMDYLSWRYGGHPYVSYGVCFVEDSNGLCGFAVLKPNVRHGLKEVVMTEIFLRAQDESVGKKLLKAVASSVRSDYIVSYFAGGTFELAMLKKSRFHSIPGQTMTFTVRLLNKSPFDPLKAENWDLTLGELETF